ncbi:MAG: type II secretion system protein N [Ramlibacter sp.]
MPWRWAVLGGGIGLLLALVVFAPARWLAGRVASSTAGQVLLLDPRGTVWTGSAQLVLTGGPGSSDAAALPTRLDWRLRPGLSGIRVLLSSACCTPQPLALAVRPGLGSTRVDVADVPSRWPAAILAGLGTPWNTLQLEGDLALRTQGLSLRWSAGRFQVEGGADLTAEGVASRLSTLRPMGSYRLRLTGGAVPGLQLSTLDGALQLTGNGQWVGSRLHFTGEATAAPDRETALANLLNIIGRRSGSRSIITIG